MPYYKVVDHIDSEVIIDTQISNYSTTLVDKSKYEAALLEICRFSSIFDLPLDFFVSINNNLAILGNDYLQNLSKPIYKGFELSDLTHNPKHAGIYIKGSELIMFIENLDEIGFIFFQEGFYLWEHIFEYERKQSYKTKPSREKSIFLFDDLKNCQYYIEKHKGGGQICEVDILETSKLFKADMNLIDSIENNYTFFQVRKNTNQYWSGKKSKNPVFEFLFQGKCKLIPLDSVDKKN